MTRQEDMDSSFRVNFHGPLNITRAILPRLRAKGKGTLLYVGSQAAWHADPSAASYCAAKFALSGTWTIPASYPHKGFREVGWLI